jgi:DNA-binding NtrC family response regulator
VLSSDVGRDILSAIAVPAFQWAENPASGLVRKMLSGFENVMHAQPTVLLVGDFSGERVDLSQISAQFGWMVEIVASPDDVCHLPDTTSIIAGMIDLRLDGCAVLRKIRQQLPGARLVACCGFQPQSDWTELRDAGAYHMVRMPFDPVEVFQSLGFLYAALKRDRKRVVQFEKKTAAA